MVGNEKSRPWNNRDQLKGCSASFNLFFGCSLKLVPQTLCQLLCCPWSCLIAPFVSCLDLRDIQYRHDILKTKLTSFSPYIHCFPGLLSLRCFLEGAGWLWSLELSRELPCVSLPVWFHLFLWSLMFWSGWFCCGLPRAFCVFCPLLKWFPSLLEADSGKKRAGTSVHDLCCLTASCHRQWDFCFSLIQ